MRLHRLFPALAAGPDTEVTGLSAHSRQISPGMIFAAIQGERSDGRVFIEEALGRGAAAILTDKRPGSWPVPVLKSDNPAHDLARAAACFHGSQPRTIVAVTGTNGKSSIVEFLRQIWAFCGHKAAAMGTLGLMEGFGGGRTLLDGMTTPDAVRLHELLAKLSDSGTERLALEASSHGLSQYRLHGVELSAGAFSNLSRDHLDYHKNFREYGLSKRRLFSEILPAGVPAVINLDDPASEYFVEAASKRGLDCVGFGYKSGACMQILGSPKPVRGGQVVDARWRGQDFQFRLSLIGVFQACNALMAAALALSLGEDRESVFAALQSLRGVPGRLQRIDGSPGAYVDFAHTPAAMEAALSAVRADTEGRLICLFGCGGDRDREKRVRMGEIAHRLADVVVVTDDNPRREDPAVIRAAICSGAPGAVEIGDRAEAIRVAVGMLSGEDSLLVLGKGHESEQILHHRSIPFSDAEVISRALSSSGVPERSRVHV